MEMPSSDQWEHIKQLLDQVWDRPPDERTAYLEEVCAGAPELRREVEALLEADAQAHPFLDEQAAEHVLSLVAAFDEPVGGDLHAGQRVGTYRIEEQVGQGGMSTVYRARRADGQFEQQVAVKVLRHVAGREFRQRFLAERQILASLHHPNIARVVDGGVLEDGRPYLVMEYVRGEPITTYCERHQLGVKERLDLFEVVAEAVQHAHQNLVVHRDLKPSNILVTDEGVPKLLDFGIAKMLRAASETSMPTTRTGMQLMTPEYAAPEQVRGDDITTATDVYTLGVLLYEMFTARRPYRLARGKPFAIMRTICEEEPTIPSEAVRQESDRLSQAGDDELYRALRGDLDAIILQALEKQPDYRYSTVDALRDDLQAYRRGQPVEARTITWSYQVRKFAYRHRYGVTAAIAFAILTIGFASFYTVSIRAERDQARREAQKAEQVTAFLMDLFEASDPERARGDTITARELLQRGVKRTEALKEQPEVQAQMLTVMGKAYRRLGRYEQARPLLEKALGRYRALYGEEHPRVASSLHDVGILAFRERDYARADSLIQRSLRIRRRILGPNHLKVAETLNDLAVVRRSQGNLDSAEALYRQALAVRRAKLDADAPQVISTLNNLAVLMVSRGRLDAAEELYRDVLTQRRKALGEQHPKVANTLNNLAVCLRRKGDLEAAESYFREALTMRRALFGNEHPKVAQSLNNLANLLRERGRLQAAAPLYREALSLRRELFGEGHVKVANSQNNLANLLRDQGDYKGAEVLYRKALTTYRKVLGDKHRYVAVCLESLVLLNQERQDYEAAERLQRRALAIYRSAPKGRRAELAENVRRLADILAAQGESEAAQPLYSEALAMESGR